jgi:hypothetical protein
MSWWSSLRTALGSLPVDYAGQHMLLLDSHSCSGSFLLAYAWLTFPSAHTVCMAESPLHYQHVCRKLGGSGATGALSWSDLSALGDAPVSLDALFGSLSERVAASPGPHCIVLDSLFPLSMRFSALELSQFVRKVSCSDVVTLPDCPLQLRTLLGPTGTLVSLMHSDTFLQHFSLLVYESVRAPVARRGSHLDIRCRTLCSL